MAKKERKGSGGNRKKGRTTRTPYRKLKHDQSWARTERNRRHRHKNHIKIHPNDLQMLQLMKDRGEV